ncbi:hypothetical protein JS531_05650 [Bifidobacterium sp. CP2]|nr:hypothetical protein [Bifidobacterium sp. CP2]MBT1181455.1 hypothetical protein [Bifidobacterium sp. CP2]
MAATLLPAGEGFADWPVRWDADAAQAVVTVPSGTGYSSRTFGFRA